MFGMEVRYFEQAVTFVQKIRFTQPRYDISCYIEYGACSDAMCLPPSSAELKTSGKGIEVKEPAKTDTSLIAQPQPVTSEKDTVLASKKDSILANKDLWQPVVKELQAFGNKDITDTEISWWIIFFEGLLGGFLALFSPCVWPIIPMTVSFFLKRNKEQTKAIREATTYGLSIVVIYVLLGLAVTLLFGASALNALSTNAVFNIFFALLLVVFAASFFGAFELTLPSAWTNKIDQKSESTTGLLSIFLMAFTLALVSFSCTGPIIGFLLVAVSTQVCPQVGWMDEHHQGDTRFHRIGLCPEVPLRGRLGIRLAPVGSRGVSINLDCHLRSFRRLPFGVDTLSSRRRKPSHQCASVFPRLGVTVFYRLYDTWAMGCSLQGHQRFHTSHEHPGLQSLWW